MSRSRKDGRRGGGHRRNREAASPRPGNAPGYCSVLDKAQKQVTHRKERRASRRLILTLQQES